MTSPGFPQIFGVTLKDQSEVKQFTAFLIDDKGHLLTVAHPFTNEQVEKVSCGNQHFSFDATPVYISYDADDVDFALLKVDPNSLRKLTAFNGLPLLSSSLKIGSALFGSGFGEYFYDLSLNKPSSNHSTEFYGTLGSEGFFSIDLSKGRHVVPGDSGSPIFSVIENKVVGLNDARKQHLLEDVEVRRGHLLPLTKISNYLKTKNKDDIHRIIFPKFRYDSDASLKVIPVDYKTVKRSCKGFFNRLFFNFRKSTYKYEKALQRSGVFDQSEINRLLVVFKNYIQLQYTLTDSEDAYYFDFQRNLKTELDDVRSTKKFYLLLGESGTGKTTALQLLFAKLAAEKSKHAVIYYSCADDLTPVYNLLVEVKKRTILLLDSFDEAPDAFQNWGEFLADIEENTHRFAKVLIACRKQFFASSGDVRKKTNNSGNTYDYQHIYLSLIEEEEIRRYVARIYQPGAPDNRYGQALNIIRKSGNLMVRPLILQFIDVILKEFAGRMPENITSYEVYKVIVNEWIAREEKVLKEASAHERKVLELTNEIVLSTYQSYLDGREKPHHLSVLRLQQIFGVDDAENLILRDRSLLKRTADNRYSLLHRTFKEYFLANLVFEGIIPEQSLDKSYFADAWRFYKEMCNTTMAALANIPEAEQLTNYKDHLAETIPCFAIHAYVHYVWKIAGITSLPEVFNGIIGLNEIDNDLRDALIDCAEEMVKNGTNTFSMEDLVVAANTYTLHTDDIENLSFILQEGNQFRFIHNSFAEYLCLYELLTESDKNDFVDALKDFDFSLLRFKTLFRSEIHHLRHIRFNGGITLLTGTKDVSVEEFNHLWYFDPGLTWTNYFNNKALVDINDYFKLGNRIAGRDLFLLLYTNEKVFEDFRILSVVHSFVPYFIREGEAVFALDSMAPQDFMPRYLSLFDKPEIIMPEMVKVEGGMFMMGSNTSNSEHEKPEQPVKLSSFQIGKFPVTNIQFAQFIKQSGYITTAEVGGWSLSSYWYLQNYQKQYDFKVDVFCNWQYDEWGKPYGRERDHYPVIHVSWFDAIAYCNYLNKISGHPPAYDGQGNLLDATSDVTADISKVKGYRLPTEAEWEFAAKGGKYSKGFEYSGSNEVVMVANIFKAEGDNYLFKVGILEPNELGLYDMSGNVWECCSDFYDSDFYRQCHKIGVVENPYCANEAPKRVLRGGSWRYEDVDCRMTYRNAIGPHIRDSDTGFRVVFVP